MEQPQALSLGLTSCPPVLTLGPLLMHLNARRGFHFEWSKTWIAMQLLSIKHTLGASTDHQSVQVRHRGHFTPAAPSMGPISGRGSSFSDLERTVVDYGSLEFFASAGGRSNLARACSMLDTCSPTASLQQHRVPVHDVRDIVEANTMFHPRHDRSVCGRPTRRRRFGNARQRCRRDQEGRATLLP